MSYYECKRCNHQTKQKNDMKKHLNRRIKCAKTIEAYKYNDEEILKLSMTNMNGDESINKLECSNCKKIYSRVDSLQRHQRLHCKKVVSNEESCSEIEIENNLKNENEIEKEKDTKSKNTKDTKYTIDEIDSEKQTVNIQNIG